VGDDFGDRDSGDTECMIAWGLWEEWGLQDACDRVHQGTWQGLKYDGVAGFGGGWNACGVTGHCAYCCVGGSVNEQ